MVYGDFHSTPTVKRAVKTVMIKKVNNLFSLLALILPLTLMSTATHAKDYIVEAIIFENRLDSNITEPHSYQNPAKPRTGAKAWLLDKQLLLEQAAALEISPNYELKHHFAWGQESLPYRNSATYTVVEKDAKGYIKVYADQLLFANIDLDYKGFRLFEKRRLKLNEKHYFDHPKFGLLLQVSRLELAKEDPL